MSSFSHSLLSPRGSRLSHAPLPYGSLFTLLLFLFLPLAPLFSLLCLLVISVPSLSVASPFDLYLTLFLALFLCFPFFEPLSCSSFPFCSVAHSLLPLVSFAPFFFFVTFLPLPQFFPFLFSSSLSSSPLTLYSSLFLLITSYFFQLHPLLSFTPVPIPSPLFSPPFLPLHRSVPEESRVLFFN